MGAAGQMKVGKRIQGNLDSYAFHCSLALPVGAVDMTLCIMGRKEADAMDCPAPALALGLGWAFSAMAHHGSPSWSSLGLPLCTEIAVHHRTG